MTVYSMTYTSTVHEQIVERRKVHVCGWYNYYYAQDAAYIIL